MLKPVEKVLLFCSDFLTINATFWLWSRLRVHAGYFSEPLPQQFLINALVIFLFWFLLFIFYGLYRTWYAQSRVDELINVGKTVSIGVFLIFLMTIDLQQDVPGPLRFSRAMIVSYWLLLVVLVSMGRLALRTFQRTLLESGIGMRNTLIVGDGKMAQVIFDELRKFPALGYEIAGFLGAGDLRNYKGAPWLGELREIAEVIKREEVEEVIVAFENDARAQVSEVLACCENLPVKIKVVPDLHDAVMGHVRTHQIYGLPLIEIMPDLMPAWEHRAKRWFDIGVALLALIFLLPLGVIIVGAIRFYGHGGVLTADWRIGRDGKLFKLYRFNASPADDTLPGGGLSFVRSMGWDKMPHLLNVLKGNLSLVGPSAETPDIVRKNLKECPFYSRRLHVQPGLTGWAQIKGGKDGVRGNLQRALQYDFFYIENMSLRMDLKILLIALYNAMINSRVERASKSLSPSMIHE